MNITHTICIAAIACLMFDEAISAPEHQVSAARTCFVKIGDTPKRPCGWTYFIREPNNREMIVGAKTADGDFSFSGLMINQGTFKVAEIYAGSPLKASGLCKLTKTAKGRVSTIDCKAKSKLGMASMKSTADRPDDWDLIIRRIVPGNSSVKKQ
ncbi:hypothetical protein [Rhizobium tropici]|nr:hypothetical protein [Rhizobium tropici]